MRGRGHQEGAGPLGRRGRVLPVPIVNLGCDLLLQLHQVVLWQRSRHDLRAELHEAERHLLEAPEHDSLVGLAERKTQEVWTGS